MYKIAEIRDSLSVERYEAEKDILIVRYIHRPIGAYFAWAMIRLGINCKVTVVLGLLSGIAGCCLIATGNYQLAVVGCVFVFIRLWLDYADGTIARATDTADKEGAYLDLTCDNVMGIGIPLAVGLNVHMPVWGLVFALFYAWSNLSIQDGKCVYGEDTDIYRTNGFSLWRLLFLCGTNVQALYHFALVAAVVTNTLNIYLYVFTVLAGLELVAVIAKRLQYAREYKE